MPTPDHTLSHEDALHHDWDASRDPALTVSPGEVVRFDCLDASGGRLRPGTTVEDLRNAEFTGHPLTGPVAVEGADSGMGLLVELLAVETGDWGVTYTYPGEDGGSGLLPDTAPDGLVHHWELAGETATFREGIEVPLAPFPGNLGVAPAGEAVSTVPPRNVGGNLDVRHLVAGSALRLPVETPGGLFSVGDGHAAQGDGEVCITAIECPMTVDVRFELLEEAPDAPWFETPGPWREQREGHGPASERGPRAGWREGPALCTTGIDPDLHEGAKRALSAMLDRLETDRDLTRPEAYLLCSVALDLSVSQVVNAPNWTVTARLPTAIFD
jgi:acetamidase/formamidase